MGGLRRRREKTITSAYVLEPYTAVAGIRRLLEIAVADTLALDNGIARNRTLIMAARALDGLLRANEWEAGLARLDLEWARRVRPRMPAGDELDVDDETS